LAIQFASVVIGFAQFVTRLLGRFIAAAYRGSNPKSEDPVKTLSAVVAMLSLSWSLSASPIDVACSSKENPPSSAPLAVNDAIFVRPGSVTSVLVLANDIVAAGNGVSVTALGPCAPPSTCQSISTGLGTVTNQGSYVTYTAPASFTADFADHFDYTLTDPALAMSSTARVDVFPQADVQVTATCQSVDCKFVVTPSILAGIRSLTFSWGDGGGQTISGTLQYNHHYYYGGTKDFLVDVTVSYFDGKTATGHTVAHVAYADTTTYSAETNGLRAYVRRIRVDDGNKQVSVNWSPIRADCSYGCGPNVWGGGASCISQCDQATVYNHAGTFNAIFRVTYAGVNTDYPISYTVTNNNPEPGFRFSLPDPNTKKVVFDGNGPYIHESTDDDGPFPLTPYEWDFGDGSTYVDRGIQYTHGSEHTYRSPGNYVVTLRVTDADGATGTTTRTVTVPNAPPVPKMTVNCRLLDCTFDAAPSSDDSGIASYAWDFGDGTTATGSRTTKHFLANGCYVVTLKLTDNDNSTASEPLTVPVGTPTYASGGGVSVDMHVQSYQAGGVTQTSNGNLNGIAEPGENIVIEPNWVSAIISSAPMYAVSSAEATSSAGAGTAVFLNTLATYDRTRKTADCWTGGNCYVLSLKPALDAAHSAATAARHWDLKFTETVDGAPTPGSPASLHLGKSFADVPPSYWAYNYIESMLHFGITGGCDPVNYCPGNAVSRAEAAVFLVRAGHPATFDPPACTTAPFLDVPCDYWAARWIAQLKADGVTSGTGGGNYSPGNTITRAEMAVFLVREKYGAAYVPPPCKPDFTDVACPGGFAADYISVIKTLGVTTGCTPTTFCPGDSIDRAQTAVMITRMFNLVVGAPACPAGFPTYVQTGIAEAAQQ
jgi:hypothetical protein